MLRVGIV